MLKKIWVEFNMTFFSKLLEFCLENKLDVEINLVQDGFNFFQPYNMNMNIMISKSLRQT